MADEILDTSTENDTGAVTENLDPVEISRLQFQRAARYMVGLKKVGS